MDGRKKEDSIRWCDGRTKPVLFFSVRCGMSDKKDFVLWFLKVRDFLVGGDCFQKNSA